MRALTQCGSRGNEAEGCKTSIREIDLILAMRGRRRVALRRLRLPGEWTLAQRRVLLRNRRRQKPQRARETGGRIVILASRPPCAPAIARARDRLYRLARFLQFTLHAAAARVLIV